MAKIRILSNKKAAKLRNFDSPKKRRVKMPWVDVEDSPRSKRKQGKRPSLNGLHKTPNRFSAPNGPSSPSKSNGSVDGPTKPGKSSSLQEQRRALPIALGREKLIAKIRQNDVIVLLGETGSGKTTQVPQYILESGIAGTRMVAVTQPRRVAATSLAARVAAEQNVKVGAAVGYSVRFDERSGPDTRIKYLTDGMIVRELLSDPLLSRYSVIIVDEAHERTLRTDLLLASLKGIQKYRSQPSDAKGKGRASLLNPLKIVVMSATLDAEKFSKFFDNAPIEYIQGRQHPVQIFHSAESQSDYLAAALRVFFQVHTDQGPGDVLIFLPGQDDIESLEKSIRLYANKLPHKSMEVVICPMYAAQAAGQNSKVFNAAPPNTRKCILATNIAETSITIPGVKYVIDTGKCKEKQYLARETGGGFDTLLTKDITKSSANQRAGRAGREGSGVCFRLYTEAAYNNMAVSADPEIRRCSLTSSVLQLKCLGQDFQELDFMDKPDYDSVVSAYKSLWLFGALNNSKELTPTGRQMAAFPLDPCYARIVLASKEYNCAPEIVEIVSVLSASSKLFVDVSDQRDSAAELRRKFRHPTGDHLTILGVVKAYQEIALAENKAGRREWCRKHFLNERALLEARDIRDQLKQTCARFGISFDEGVRADNNNDDAVLKALAHGLVQNSALLQPDGVTYKQTMGHTTVKIHPSSALSDRKHPAIIFNELVYTNQVYARGVSSIPKSFFLSIPTLNQRHS
ncbi:putative ATP-dependent RNA helicase dhr2 [Pleurotus ostreatus]|uniref:RNA helicase n=1 Tax=Pleurotus ostreatus TaxID=5322 RepID=A0A8H6ZSQ9_PLEOS|nr:putative ATP-dependent RNA helicase dhr2 [Pleurotus ostreatus]KAF7422857.1 putative ATP-dependent RNA helicase dhr2 [Pleurotus ostreatus]